MSRLRATFLFRRTRPQCPFVARNGPPEMSAVRSLSRVNRTWRRFAVGDRRIAGETSASRAGQPEAFAKRALSLSWDQRFFDPIELPGPGGRKLVTLRNAALYITRLPKTEQCPVLRRQHERQLAPLVLSARTARYVA